MVFDKWLFESDGYQYGLGVDDGNVYIGRIIHDGDDIEFVEIDMWEMIDMFERDAEPIS